MIYTSQFPTLFSKSPKKPWALPNHENWAPLGQCVWEQVVLLACMANNLASITTPAMQRYTQRLGTGELQHVGELQCQVDIIIDFRDHKSDMCLA